MVKLTVLDGYRYIDTIIYIYIEAIACCLFLSKMHISQCIYFVHHSLLRPSPVIPSSIHDDITHIITTMTTVSMEHPWNYLNIITCAMTTAVVTLWWVCETVVVSTEPRLPRAASTARESQDTVPERGYDGARPSDHHQGQTGIVRLPREHHTGSQVFHTLQAVWRTTDQTGELFWRVCAD